MSTSSTNSNCNSTPSSTRSSTRSLTRSFLVAAGAGTLAVVALAFGQPASAGGDPIEPIVPELPELDFEMPDTPIVTLPDDFVPIPPGDDPEITIPDDLAPNPPDDDPDPTDPTLPDSRCEASGDCPDPTDPTPGTPQGSLPQTGASAVIIAGAAILATTAGTFLCLAAGRRSRFRS